MQLKKIGREQVVIPEHVSELCPNLAEDAAAILGYKGLKDSGRPVTGLSTLQQALAEKEIEVLKASDVAVYKAERWAERNNELFAEFLREGKEHLLNAESSRYWSNWPTVAAWDEVKISEYKEAIPVHILNKAVEIKKACPDAEIFIEHLREAKDPFLLVKHEGKKVYVDVWEEPGFEASL